VLLLAALKLTLRLELGPEYDSNANRAEIVQGAVVNDVPTGSFLVRTTVRPQLAWRSGRNTLRVGGLLGGKVFFNPDVQDQNTIVGDVAVEDRVRVADWLDVGAAIDYYDAAQQAVAAPCEVRSCDRHRDFRSGSALARISLFDDPGELTLSGGYRGLQWKPDPQFDFQGGQLNVLAAVRLYHGPPEREHEIDLAASYHLERRLYASPIEVNQCPPGTTLTDTCIAYGADARTDWYHDAGVELTWVRAVLLSIAYAVQINQSNSFGQSLVRHVFTAKLAAQLPWQLYLTLKGQLLVSRYPDPILLDRQVSTQTFASIDDERRNAAIVDLERPIGRTGLAVEVRYSFYTNELGASPASFQRHVAYLGVTYKVASK
jgi:hypothetical protein